MPIKPTRHIAEHPLELYLLGRLNPRPIKSVEEHLLVCHECLDEAERFDLYLSGLCAALQQFRGEEKVMTSARAQL